MRPLPPLRALALLLPALAALSPALHAAERITLANGFTLDCTRREPLAPDSSSTRVRLYTTPTNYLDVPAASIVAGEAIPDAPAPVLPAPRPAAASIPDLLTHAGQAHRIDSALLAAVVHAESNFHPTALSRTGARGLMQLMPATAAILGVHDSFAPADNIEGGSLYLDQLLTRYHDNLALALAAYNAGPGAVDRYHGIPPFAETRAYVARVIREFNRRKTLLVAQNR